MIVVEEFQLPDDDRILTRTYSDEGYLIIQDETGNMYGEAIDPKDMNRTYTESNIKIKNEEPEEEEEIDFDFVLPDIDE